VIEDDADINALRFAIEDRALLLIATQQPLVHDLRTIAAVLISSPTSSGWATTPRHGDDLPDDRRRNRFSSR